MRGNLFVVSRVGQLRNAQTFISEYAATDNYLAVLLTPANPVLSENILANVDEGCFEAVVEIVQPTSPLAQGRKKNAIIYRQIEELLLSMSAEHGVRNLFLCNCDNYYSLFERVIETRQLDMSISLLEEGLTTYAFTGKRPYLRNVSTDWAEVRLRGRHVERASVQAARSVAILLATLASWALRGDAVQLVKDAWVRLVVRRQHRYGSITHFDNAYVYFPDKVYSGNVEVDNVRKLEFKLEQSVPPQALDAVDDGSVVFVSQKYIPYEPYFNIIFDIFGEMGLEKVLFKFHPREDRALFTKAWELAQRQHPGVMVVSTPHIDVIPVEELMMAGKVSQLVGLTSTALMYGHAMFPDIAVTSVGARFKQLAESGSYDVSKRALSEFNRDLEVFMDVSGVAQF